MHIWNYICEKCHALYMLFSLSTLPSVISKAKTWLDFPILYSLHDTLDTLDTLDTQ